MSDDARIKYGTIFLVSFLLITYGSVMFSEWVDYKKSITSTPQLISSELYDMKCASADTLEDGTIQCLIVRTARPDAIIMG